MAISRGNASTRVDANASSAVTNWTSAPTAGQKVIVWVWGSFTTAPTVKDNGSPQRTGVLAASKIDSTNTLGIWIFYLDNVQPSGAYSVTITFGSSSSFSGGGLAYANVASGGPSATNSNTGTTPTAATSGAVSNGSNALYAAGFVDTAAGTDTVTVGGGFTAQPHLDDGTTFDEGGGADLINATGSQNCQWTISNSGRVWSACIATWAEAAAGSAPAFPPMPRVTPRRLPSSRRRPAGQLPAADPRMPTTTRRRQSASSTRRPTSIQPPAPDAAATLPPALQPRRRLSLPARSRVVMVPVPVPAAAPPAYVPAGTRSRRLAALVHSRVVMLPAPITTAPQAPAYDPTGQRRWRLAALVRARVVMVPAPITTAPPPPVYIAGNVRRWRMAALVHSRVVMVPAPITVSPAPPLTVAVGVNVRRRHTPMQWYWWLWTSLAEYELNR